MICMTESFFDKTHWKCPKCKKIYKEKPTFTTKCPTCNIRLIPTLEEAKKPTGYCTICGKDVFDDENCKRHPKARIRMWHS